MSTIREPDVSCTGKSDLRAFKAWVSQKMPYMAVLLDKLDAGETPTFLDIMGAISNCVAFSTECDSLEQAEWEKFSETSGNYCRFCC